MKKIFIPWQLFRQTLILRTQDHLESWLSRWRYSDDGAILIGGAISLSEDTLKPAGNQELSVPAKADAAPRQLARRPMWIEKIGQRTGPRDINSREIDCFYER